MMCLEDDPIRFLFWDDHPIYFRWKMTFPFRFFRVSCIVDIKLDTFAWNGRVVIDTPSESCCFIRRRQVAKNFTHGVCSQIGILWWIFLLSYNSSKIHRNSEGSSRWHFRVWGINHFHLRILHLHTRKGSNFKLFKWAMKKKLLLSIILVG